MLTTLENTCGKNGIVDFQKLFHLDVRHHTLEVFTAVGELPAPNGQVVANIPATLVSHLVLILQLGSAPPLEGILL